MLFTIIRRGDVIYYYTERRTHIYLDDARKNLKPKLMYIVTSSTSTRVQYVTTTDTYVTHIKRCRR